MERRTWFGAMVAATLSLLGYKKVKAEPVFEDMGKPMWPKPIWPMCVLFWEGEETKRLHFPVYYFSLEPLTGNICLWTHTEFKAFKDLNDGRKVWGAIHLNGLSLIIDYKYIIIAEQAPNGTYIQLKHDSYGTHRL